MPVVQRQFPGRNSADNCGGWVVQFLNKVVYMPAVVFSSTRWSMSPLCCAVQFIDGYDVPVIMQRRYVTASMTISGLHLRGQRSALHLAD